MRLLRYCVRFLTPQARTHQCASREHPSHTAIAKLRGHFESDPHWYPGKVTENAKKRGWKPLLTAHKKRCVAEAAMAEKREGKEPSAAGVITRAPRATLNPNTGEPFTAKYILRVFHTLCAAPSGNNPWRTMLQRHNPRSNQDPHPNPICFYTFKPLTGCVPAAQFSWGMG